MNKALVDTHQKSLDAQGYRSMASQTQGPNTVGKLLRTVGLSSFGRTTEEKTTEVLAEIVQTVNSEKGWIDASIRNGTVGTQYRDMYGNTPSSTVAAIRELRNDSGDLLSREVKPVKDSSLWGDYKASLNMEQGYHEALGLKLSDAEGRQYTYKAQCLRDIDLKSL